MLPPWERHPEIPAGSIGWRMGRGEDYYNSFYRWFSRLSPAERDRFALAHPPPDPWRDLYRTIADYPWPD